MGGSVALSSSGGGKVTLAYSDTTSNNYTLNVPASNDTIASQTFAHSIQKGMKNFIINGNFDIWQYGTSQTVSGYGSADRWMRTVTGTVTYSIETTDVPQGSYGATKWVTGAASSFGQDRQFIEQHMVKSLRGKTVTASMMCKVGGGFAGVMGFEVYYSTATDSSIGFNGVAISTTQTGTTSTSYTKHTATFTVPSNAVGLYIGIVPSVVQSTVGAYAMYTQVQLEEGDIATPFETRLRAFEWILCQRYYEVMYNTHSTNTAYTCAYFKVSKRITPTLTVVQQTGSGLPAYALLPYNEGVYQDGAATATGTARITASAEL